MDEKCFTENADRKSTQPGAQGSMSARESASPDICRMSERKVSDTKDISRLQRMMSASSLTSLERPISSEPLTRNFSMNNVMLSMQNPIFTQSTKFKHPVYRSVQIGRAASSAGFSDPGISVPLSVAGTPIGEKAKKREPDPPPGDHLEKSTTFYTNVKPAIIMQKLRVILNGMKIDFTEKTDKFKFKCETYPNGFRLPFNIQIFSHSSEYAVEMQRRSGDCICFSRIHNRFLRKCAESGLCDLDICPPQLSSHSAPPMESDDCVIELEESELEGSLKPLMEMADSECMDVKLNAICAISELSKGKAVVDWIAKRIDDHIKLFEKLLCVEVQDIYRATVTSVANLATNKDICTKFDESSCVKSLIRLLRCDNAQVIRESSRALKNIGAILKSNMSVSPKDVYGLVKSSDPRVRSNGEALQQHLRFASIH
mmetsp:Transcript_23731/g.33178  ORF Transcript_23731/g.33178 Transcript_23731/m.33178 type:complete len:429 (-) Transcript_23731:208-1494(-)|eukprot:CAMPEP_0184488158 /NCGR_PEP_ID=MMETSP0113_2-20130426/10558_1 /TAXON_ID=91329 /ORGANISM="Norrisiella sphaerica, Strain BC52" /LENGTH=428 /DNA_ID=CAMNT_0026870641 /DNA_START=89 /DNA_END=1375 /DNA_ORIENTATION=-